MVGASSTNYPCDNGTIPTVTNYFDFEYNGVLNGNIISGQYNLDSYELPDCYQAPNFFCSAGMNLIKN